MKQKTWVLLPFACVLLVFCAVHAVRKPAASDAAPRIEACAGPVQSDLSRTNTRSQQAMESMDTSSFQTSHELQRRRLETARVAERIERQEAARELQRRQ